MLCVCIHSVFCRDYLEISIFCLVISDLPEMQFCLAPYFRFLKTPRLLLKVVSGIAMFHSLADLFYLIVAFSDSQTSCFKLRKKITNTLDNLPKIFEVVDDFITGFFYYS